MPHNTTTPHLAFALAIAIAGCVVPVATGQIEAPEDPVPAAESDIPDVVEVAGDDIVLMDAGTGMGELTPVDHPTPTGP